MERYRSLPARWLMRNLCSSCCAAREFALLREVLGDGAERVRFEDMHRLGRNPARIIPAWREFLDESAPEGRPVRGIGEPIWPVAARRS